ncbi:vacuolar protein sorting-associated protein 8 homolog isoform X2 [Durio zibethinus]|uniref:Vacuolar protein sorting-associated protein 8 homolog isoform X2 n=1 Tax=Durio zibethinus TaxID=66656 RepID=A0A6P5ZYU0_DURZI|nr:vacuolar protein sorting-associated protein 8 homolog isoform X2 [Durio zibethinus]
MELDLDSLLESHLSSDSGDDSNSVPHRTIDEILNDSDSSTSSFSPSSPTSTHHLPGNRVARSHTLPQDFVESLKESDALSQGPAESSKPSPFTRIGDPVWRVSSSSSSSSKQLPTLFGGVKSNAKPGAALAAAAAASRSVPTPHAAAIKSRRAGSGGVPQKVIDSDEHEVSLLNWESVGVSSESSVSGEKLDIDDYNNDNKMGDFQSADAHENGEAIDKKDKESETDKVIERVDGSSKRDFDENLNKEVTVLGSDEVLAKEIAPVSVYENSVVLDANDSYQKSVSSLPDIDQERNIDKDLQIVDWERENVANDIPSLEDGEERVSGGADGADGDDAISISDISELVEERLEQLESERISRRVEKNSRATMKPLELAEELEKKQASTGLHWEEGAAAQPMRLEGVKRGSTTLGYFDVEVNNAISRTLSSQAFRRDHGSPQVLAVHLNFVAVGMTKGVIILVPSKYSAHHADSMDSKCLLDGQRTGTVLSASPLLFDDSCGSTLVTSQGNTTFSTSSIGSKVGGVVGGDAGWKLFAEGSSMVEEGVVIFVTYQTALVVRLTPTLEVYAQLSRPDGVREGSMPYTAWTCMTQPCGSSSENAPTETAERVSLLALAWDRKVQVAKLVKSDLKVYGKWSLDSSAIGVAWLDDHMMVVLTMTGQLYLFARDGTVIHQTAFTVDGLGGDDLIAYHTHFINVFGNPEKAYHNCVTVRGASVYILGPMHLAVCRLLPWKERIQVLRKAGDWMGALNMAMTLYDGQAHGVIDLPRNLNAVQEAIMPYLVELLLSYVDEVFSYISVAFCNQIGKKEQPDDPESRSSSVHSEIKEQFTRVGGVAVEFCVHIKRTDILFDEIFSKFVAIQQRDTFLELLEPYILKDMLGCLPPEIMQALVEHYSSKGWLQRVEQCVLHMDISSLDFNQVVILCREHGLYGALVYLFNKGLDDYRAPLEELLVVLRNSQRESASGLGYRMLVYLKYCFTGLAFPPGHGTLPPSRLSSLRTELLQFLLEVSDGHNRKSASRLAFEGAYLNMYYLLELDTEATLDVLKCAFIEDKFPEPDSFSEPGNANAEAKKEKDLMAESEIMLVQNTINALVHVLDKNVSRTDGLATSDNAESIEAWPSKKDMGYLFEFIAYYVACGRAKISKTVLNQILEFLTLENNGPQSVSTISTETPKRREKQLLALLEVVPETDWNQSYVLQLCENALFYQVCGLIHAIRHQYLAALDSYMKDVEEPIHAFAFINNTLMKLSDGDYTTFRSAVISRIPELVNLSREGTFFLVIDHFNDESSHILTELNSHPNSLFLYLKTVIEVHLSGTLNFSYLREEKIVDVFSGRKGKDPSKELEAYLERMSNFPKFLRSNPLHVTDDMIELYLELLCQFERDSVLKFLETFDSYRVEHCLRLCQEYGIIDAAAFLLERVGDVGSALLLTLSGLNDKFTELDTAVGSVVSKMSLGRSASMEHFNSALKMKEVNDIRNILHACIELCQRNTPRLNPEESEMLWFRLLDSFCEPLMGSYCDESVSEKENPVGMLIESLGSQEEEECIIKWRIPKSHKSGNILRKLFSQFIKEIVEGMIGYVRLPTIMSKLLSDNGSQEFGDFKLTILGMLGTYGFERRILDTAKSLIEDDTFYTMSLLKKGASHGYAPRSLLCCICNSLLTKNSSSFRVRVFSCGHATHLQCELLENEASTRGFSSGCPICLPKKNTQKSRNKSALTENGLVSSLPSRPLPAQGSTLYPHENDALDNSYGLQQISRFEILSNLQKDQRLGQIENLPQLRLAPPAIYHEKVKKGSELLAGESSSNVGAIEKPSKSRQLKELKLKGSSLRFPLKSSIFGKEKISK